MPPPRVRTAASTGAARAAFGAFFAISYEVGSLWVAVIGRIISAAGFPATFATMGASFAAAAIVIAVTVRDRPSSPPRGPAPDDPA